MATQTNKTRTITGYITDLLEYPRWVLERDVDFSNCRYGSHYNVFIKECTECQFGRSTFLYTLPWSSFGVSCLGFFVVFSTLYCLQ